MKKVRVLSLDGGGIRGVIPATVMVHVEEKLQEFSGDPNARIADYFDMIVGTSTGGILGCFYLMPNKKDDGPSSAHTAQEALEFYTERGFGIFNGSKKPGLMGFRQLFNAASYKADAIESIFKEVFGSTKMKDLLKRCVVPAYDMESTSSVFFNSREQKAGREYYVRDVVRSTSAAPTYFPPAKILNLAKQRSLTNIDGGVFANNPTMCAYAECRNTDFTEIGVDRPSASQMMVLSIGTGGGRVDLKNVPKSHKWGVIGWAKSVPEIMMDGSLDTVHYQIENMFGTLEGDLVKNYKRVDVYKDEASGVDERDYAKDMADASPENIQKLKIAGKKTIERAQAATENSWGLDEFLKKLVEQG